MALKIHESRQAEYLDRGYVLQDGWLYNPEIYCLKQLRNNRVCTLDKDHKMKRHSSVTFACDGCGKQRVGKPVAEIRNEYDGEVEVVLCLLCTRGIT